MSTLLTLLKRKLHDTFGEDALHWYHRSYIFDWGVATAAWVIAWWIKILPPYHRDFSVDDVLISHVHRKNQISGDMNMLVALLIPGITVIVVGTLRISAMEIHHGLLSLWSGSGFTILMTEFLKNRVGRLRPDFLDRCKWNETLAACTGDPEQVTDGRRSFPSGHSSAAWAGMTFLSLYLAGVTGAWCLHRSTPSRYLSSSRLVKFCITLAPIVFATWVAISRLEDYRHHREDVIVGSLLGMCTAATCYLIYWPNPFTLQESDMIRGVARPRSVYEESSTARTENAYDYELAGMEHAAETV
ncbi:hypothetical protein NM688_g1485 [Phlebia brevispora]|uniref:Uncharacterized protein n=1 Tax=Phlebia brevispora TaxID=194682 RepID=A0ACC1TBN1_9APHY|nr:hypothetical protein NM688_g1485 [Phlebia brevispora]